MGPTVLVFLLVGYGVLTERAKPVPTEPEEVSSYQSDKTVISSLVMRESDLKRLGVKPIKKVCFMRVHCDDRTGLDNLIEVFNKDDEDFEGIGDDEDLEDFEDVDEVDEDIEDDDSEEQLQRYEEPQKAPSAEGTTATTPASAAPSRKGGKKERKERRERKQKKKEERQKKKEERKRKKEEKEKKPKVKKPRELTCFATVQGYVKIAGNCSLWAPGVGTCESGNMTDPYNSDCNPLPNRLVASAEPLPQL